ncbi:MAG TPA: rRNA maturation RNase YbeY [Verrucomicrobiota bacterium]|nr:rRNA maturation RNase YbeY [Verrucomicrobiota bacterium]
MNELSIRNRQRARRIHTRLLRRIVEALLDSLPGVRGYELGIRLVGASEMARINWGFLNHEGSTDVITFDHSERAAVVGDDTIRLHGEIYVCVDDAVKQAREFKTAWQSEVVRYVVHGVLHLLGHDDMKAAARRKMKREENRLLGRLERRFRLSQLAVGKLAAH